MKKEWRIGLFALLVMFCITRISDFSHITPEAIRDFLMTFGALAPIIYIILFTFVPLTLFPDAILAIAAGLVFGIVPGFLYTMIGALCGGSLAFIISRKLGQRFLEDKLQTHNDIREKIETHGFWIILFMRFIPLIPFDVISYAAGASGVKYREFFWATLLGIIPGVVILVSIGDGLASPNQPQLYIGIASFILLGLIANGSKKKFFNSHSEDTVQVEK